MFIFIIDKHISRNKIFWLIRAKIIFREAWSTFRGVPVPIISFHLEWILLCQRHYYCASIVLHDLSLSVGATACRSSMWAGILGMLQRHSDSRAEANTQNTQYRTLLVNITSDLFDCWGARDQPESLGFNSQLLLLHPRHLPIFDILTRKILFFWTENRASATRVWLMTSLILRVQCQLRQTSMQ